MKKFFSCFAIFAFSLSSNFANPPDNSISQITKLKSYPNKSKLFFINSASNIQQNLIGEVTALDLNAGKIVILTDTKTSITISINDKTAFRRVLPGETSLANAEQIKISDIKIGDRVLIPGGAAGEQTPVRQVIVMARAVLNLQRQDEQEKRRARTVNGRITAINAEKKEITFQTRVRNGSGVESLTATAAGNVKMLRYAPDSLKISDAVASSFTDLRVGDQIRVVGDRNTDGTQITAEEIIAGTVTRAVGSVSEINSARGEITIKNIQNGQLMTVAIGKNTTLRRITPEVAQTLKQRFQQIRERRNNRNSDNSNEQSTTSQRRNNDERRNQNTSEQTNRNPRQLFDNLPAITIGELKKGDAVLITAMTGNGSKPQMTAVSIISGEGDLQQILQRTQGGRNANSNMSPGLPGNVSGGNASTNDDDEP